MKGELAVEGEERLIIGQSGRLFLTISAGWGLFSLGQQALPPLLPSIVEELSVTDFQAGLGLSLMWACYAVCQYLGGRITTDLSVKSGLLGGIAVLASGFFLLAGTTTYFSFLAAAVLIGCGGGVYLIAARVSIAELFVERRGQAFGANLAIGMAGNILAAGTATIAVAIAVWRALYIPLVLVLAIIALLLHAWIPQSYRIEPISLQIHSTILRVFRTRQMVWLVLVFGLYSIVWQGLIGFFPTYLRSVRLLPALIANGAFAIIFLIGIVMSPLAGRLSDHYPRPAVGFLSLVITAAGIFVLISVGEIFGLIGGVLLVGVGLHGFPPVMQAYLMDRFSGDSMGSDFGAFRMLYTGIGSIGPAYVGLVQRLTDYRIAFASLAIALIISSAILYSVTFR